MKMRLPNGRAIKASAKMPKDQKVPVNRSVKGNSRCGKTSTEAIAKTKKSKNSEVRPTITPIAISPGATRPCASSSVRLLRRHRSRRDSHPSPVLHSSTNILQQFAAAAPSVRESATLQAISITCGQIGIASQEGGLDKMSNVAAAPSTPRSRADDTNPALPRPDRPQLAARARRGSGRLLTPLLSGCNAVVLSPHGDVASQQADLVIISTA